jgi:hypothetical protein
LEDVLTLLTAGKQEVLAKEEELLKEELSQNVEVIFWQLPCLQVEDTLPSLFVKSHLRCVKPTCLQAQ